MVVRGYVKNGVVVLEGGIRLPEGQEVTVIGNGTDPGHAYPEGTTSAHSVLDIPPVSLGPLLPSRTDEEDLLGEMLDDRR